ncbi:MAG: hypothetical protein COW89_10395 [Nitrospinae bacterium CG22_combo_CG10-13_8_21_14_all_47_10]|nr:MAG: hypothetical protein COW89_10395 [Nitrospinae bacterium CG22_combo_CG10-13_8_21_14_all_47_10]
MRSCGITRNTLLIYLKGRSGTKTYRNRQRGGGKNHHKKRQNKPCVDISKNETGSPVPLIFHSQLGPASTSKTGYIFRPGWAEPPAL